MASYFTLELDTTGPDIEIYMPSFILSSGNLNVTVQADEVLEEGFQEFYIIDKNGQRYEVTLTYDNNRFVGTVPLNLFPLGVATFYARVKDTVLNPSPLVSKSFNISKGARASIHSIIKTRAIQNNIKSRSIKAVVK